MGFWSRLVRAMGDDRRGFSLNLAMGLFRIGSAGFYCAYQARRCAYGLGLVKTRRVGAPVVSIGNITAGGTGKTPMIVGLARRIRGRGRRPAILRRGYGATAAGEDDETRLIRAAVPGVPVLIGRDRVAAAGKAIEGGADCLLLDDGFQHWRLERDLDVVLIDATCPFGFQHMLPRGLLREPPFALFRAGAVAITRADLMPPEYIRRLRDLLARMTYGVPIALARHRPGALRPVWPADGGPDASGGLAGRKVVAVSAIGNPVAFSRTLAAARAMVLAEVHFDDHHVYTPEDVAAIDRVSEAATADFAVVTDKDAVKLAGLKPARLPVFSLPIEIEFLDGEEPFLGAVWKAIDREGTP